MGGPGAPRAQPAPFALHRCTRSGRCASVSRDILGYTLASSHDVAPFVRRSGYTPRRCHQGLTLMTVPAGSGLSPGPCISDHPGTIRRGGSAAGQAAPGSRVARPEAVGAKRASPGGGTNSHPGVKILTPTASAPAGACPPYPPAVRLPPPARSDRWWNRVRPGSPHDPSECVQPGAVLPVRTARRCAGRLT